MNRKWANHLCKFWDVNDRGWRCCLNHVFCGPCIWCSALSEAGVPNAELYFMAALSGRITDSKSLSVLSDIAVITGRVTLARKLKIEENPIFSAATKCPCLCLCSQIQEVNTVMEGRNLKYGCAKLEEKTSETVGMRQTSPPPLIMARA